MSIEEARRHLDHLNRAAVTPTVPNNTVPKNAVKSDAAKPEANPLGTSTLPVSTPKDGAATKPVEPKQ